MFCCERNSIYSMFNTKCIKKLLDTPTPALHRELDVTVNLYTTAKGGKRILLYYSLIYCQKSRIPRKLIPRKSAKAMNEEGHCQGKRLRVPVQPSQACNPGPDAREPCLGAARARLPAQVHPLPSTLPASVQDQHRAGAASFPRTLSVAGCTPGVRSLAFTPQLETLPSFRPPIKGASEPCRLMVRTQCQQV